MNMDGLYLAVFQFSNYFHLGSFYISLDNIRPPLTY